MQSGRYAEWNAEGGMWDEGVFKGCPPRVDGDVRKIRNKLVSPFLILGFDRVIPKESHPRCY